MRGFFVPVGFPLLFSVAVGPGGMAIGRTGRAPGISVETRHAARGYLGLMGRCDCYDTAWPAVDRIAENGGEQGTRW